MRPSRLGPRAWLAALAGAALIAAGFLAAGQPVHLGPASGAEPAGAFDRHVEVNVTAVDCPEGYDNQASDDVCLAYDGQIPGPTLVFEEGQSVQLTLNHRVSATIDNTTASPELADDLTEKRYTLHRHGVSVANCEDGVARPKGTTVCDSTVGPPDADREPDGSITYNFTTSFPGFWHYHDHSLGLGVGTTHGDHAGAMAEHRGLWGAMRVLPDGETTENVFDLHLLNTGPNGGLGLDETVAEGERFELLATGLGDFGWRVNLAGPDGKTIWRAELGPGVARGVTVEAAEPGTYEWTARSFLVNGGEAFHGEVVVE